MISSELKDRFRLLVQLFVSFFRVGALTFGGGYAMLPVLEGEVVDRRNWIGDEELLDFYAIAQTTPGVIVVNTATFIGYKESRYLGAAVATLGVITPSIIIITILALAMHLIPETTLAQKALNGINVAVASLLITAVVRLGKKSITSPARGVVAMSAFLAVQFWGVSSIVIILIAALLGIVYTGRAAR